MTNRKQYLFLKASISPILFVVGLLFSLLVLEKSIDESIFGYIFSSDASGSHDVITNLIVLLIPATILVMMSTIAALIEAPARLPENSFRYMYWAGIIISITVALAGVIMNMAHLGYLKIYSSCQNLPGTTSPQEICAKFETIPAEFISDIRLLIYTVFACLILRYIGHVYCIRVHIEIETRRSVNIQHPSISSI